MIESAQLYTSHELGPDPAPALMHLLRMSKTAWSYTSHELGPGPVPGDERGDRMIIHLTWVRTRPSAHPHAAWLYTLREFGLGSAPTLMHLLRTSKTARSYTSSELGPDPGSTLMHLLGTSKPAHSRLYTSRALAPVTNLSPREKKCGNRNTNWVARRIGVAMTTWLVF